MKTNKIALSLALLSVPALAFAQTNSWKNAVINVTIIASLAVFVFVIASLSTHMSTIAKIMLKKAQENKKTLSLIALVGLSVSANAAVTENGPVRFIFDSMPSDSMSFYVLIGVFSLLFLITLLLSRSMFTMLRMLYGIELKKKEAVAEVETKKENAWDRWLTRWNSAVPVEKEADVMLDHDYDGIKELDNSLPPWWKYGFYLTIFIAFAYIINYHVGGNGKSQLEEYAVEMKDAEQQKAIAAASNKSNVDEANIALLTEATALEHGKSIFMQNCATCHGAKGEGLAGPNLTDKFWIHGGDIKSVYTTIKNGVIQKGMVKWEGILKPTEIHEVASFVWKLHENPVAGKEPQGVEFDPQAATPADSSATGGGASANISTRK